MGRAGIDLFIEDGAYTTLSSAVVILVVLTLLFSSTAAIWSMSRAGDTQVAADSGALAGANVVSSYHTAATVVDASILSLGLAGFATIGTGLVAILIPGAEPVAGNMVDTGIEIIKTRNKFAKSASEGLQKIETALPYLIAARATQAVSAQDTDSVTYTGTALAVPRTSESDFAALKGSEISTDTIKDTSDDLGRAAEELRKASEDTAKAKERAWLADCGGSDKGSVSSCSCMWERAKSLRISLVLKIHITLRALRGSRKWRSIARRPTIASAWQMRSRLAKVRKNRQIPLRERRSSLMRVKKLNERI
ncbi:MAG: hypothetical protein ACLU7D_12550 [Collinsella sp.]